MVVSCLATLLVVCLITLLVVCLVTLLVVCLVWMLSGGVLRVALFGRGLSLFAQVARQWSACCMIP